MTTGPLPLPADGPPDADQQGIRGVPWPVTRRFGRDAEIALVLERVRDPMTRLITLTGPGGVGKTRLAIEVALALADVTERDVALVPLADLQDPATAGPAIARVLGVETSGAGPLTGEIAAAIGNRDLALFMDNFEHLLPARSLLAELLAGCPGLTVVVTSRVPLRVSSEWHFPVPPFPEPGETAEFALLAEIPAIRLFADRASAANPDFKLTAGNAQTVAAICQRLDGLPLAIELAAARSRFYSTAAILNRLDDRLRVLSDGPSDAPSRQRSMRNAIAWSHDLLPDDQRTLFARLSVFVGGFTAEAAEAIGGGPSVVESLAALVDHGLVLPCTNSLGEPRFGMPETIREYAVERLGESGEEPVIRDAHAAYIAGLGSKAEEELEEPASALWLQRVGADLANIRTALDWLRERGRVDEALRLATQVRRIWMEPSRVPEGRTWFTGLLQLANTDTDASVHGMALHAAANLAIVQRDYDTAQGLAEAALERAGEAGDDRIVCAALGTVRYLAMDQGRLDEAAALLTEDRALAIACGRFWDAAEAANNLARVATERGEYDEAIARHQESLAEWKRIGDLDNAMSALGSLGWLYRVTADLSRARDAYETVLDYAVEHGKRYETAAFLTGFAALARCQMDNERAARLFAAADAQFRALGTPLPRNYQRANHEMANDLRKCLGETAFTAAWAEGHHRALQQAVAEAQTLPRARVATGSRLSPREIDVLRLMVDGRGDAEIAETLYISRKTASNHVAAIIEKLGVANRTAAATLAVRRGLV